jgi:hypothetical protein
MKEIFGLSSATGWSLMATALVLAVLLVISFRSRSYVFSQYLTAMTGIRLKPAEVRGAFKRGGKEGVRELFLDLIIREDLKGGPVEIPEVPVVEEAAVEEELVGSPL